MASKRIKRDGASVVLRRDAAVMQGIARVLADRGVAVAPLLPDGPVGKDFLTTEHPELCFRETAAFFERAAGTLGDTEFGFNMGIHRDFRNLGLVAYSAITAPTLDGCLTAFSENLSCYSDRIEIQYSNQGRLRFVAHEPKDLCNRQYMEFLLTLILKSIGIYLEARSGNRGITAKSICLDLDNTADKRARVQFWGCPIKVEADKFEVQFHLSDLSRPMRSADPFLHRILQDFADRVRQDDMRRANTLFRQLCNAIERGLGRQKMTQDVVAQELGMSTRTLSRELNRQSLRFFNILDDIRHDLARSYLCDSDLPPSEIATRLGYASLSSFNDAFRRWTMNTPGQFRRKIKAEQKHVNPPDQKT